MVNDKFVPQPLEIQRTEPRGFWPVEKVLLLLESCMNSRVALLP